MITATDITGSVAGNAVAFARRAADVRNQRLAFAWIGADGATIAAATTSLEPAAGKSVTAPICGRPVDGFGRESIASNFMGSHIRFREAARSLLGMSPKLVCAAAMAFAMMSCGSGPRDQCVGTTFPNCVYAGLSRTHGVNPATGDCELMCNCENWPPCPDGGASDGLADGG